MVNSVYDKVPMSSINNGYIADGANNQMQVVWKSVAVTFGSTLSKWYYTTRLQCFVWEKLFIKIFLKVHVYTFNWTWITPNKRAE